MNDFLGLLLRFDWVAFSLFMVAVACLFFCIWVVLQFVEEITPDAPPPSTPPIENELNHPQRRKHDRKNR